MTKTAGKFILIVGCVAVLGFLLLPFLETTAPDAKTAAGKKATPQIFTSNPLTELVNRMARFFGVQRAARQNPQVLTAKQAEGAFGTPAAGETYADSRAAANNISTEATPESGRRNGGYGDASLQNEEGDWVLIRQTTPDGVTPGMHEVNSKDNAYDSYVKQERSARFTPAASVKKPTEVPPTKLAALFNPIKRFFGFDEADSVNAGGFDAQEGALLASSDGFEGSSHKNGSAYANGAGLDMPSLSGSMDTTAPLPSTQTNLLTLLDPTAAIRETADFLADSKYPDPKTPAEKKSKEEYIKALEAKYGQEYIAKMQERLIREAQGQEPQNLFARTIDCGDKVSALPANGCFKRDNTPATAQEMNATRKASIDQFYAQTGLSLPPAGMTVVLSKATTLEELMGEEVTAHMDSDEGLTPEEKAAKERTALTRELYQFMLDKCQGKSCYWVANEVQIDPQLRDSVDGANLTFKGDPLGKYQKFASDFIAKKQAAMPENETDEYTDIQRLVSAASPAYVVYTAEELAQIQTRNRELLYGKGRPEDGTALYVSSAAIGQELAKDLQGRATFFYGKDGSSLMADPKKSTADHALSINRDLADQVIYIKEIIHSFKQGAAQQVVSSNASSAVQKTQEAVKQETQNFDKNNNLGHAQRGQ